MKSLRYMIISGSILLMLPSGYAQVVTPLHITTESVILDEFGQALEGTASEPGDLVQVLRADSGILPPLKDGRPDSSNPLVSDGTAGIGQFMPRSQARPGKFGHCIGGSSRPGNTAKLFVRVFNAPTLVESSFYEDSEVVTVDGNKVLLVNIARTVKPLDPDDDDGDGLNNSYEKSYDSNPTNPDTDGDGMLDGAEHLAGTDLKSRSSVLQMARINGISGGKVVVEWDSVPGKFYKIQRALSPDLSQGFADVEGLGEKIPAASDAAVTAVEVPDPGEGIGFYRVKLVVE